MTRTPTADRCRLARRLSRNGKFIVRFVSYPQYPEVVEFIDRSTGRKPIRYINLDALPGANISYLVP